MDTGISLNPVQCLVRPPHTTRAEKQDSQDFWAGITADLEVNLEKIQEKAQGAVGATDAVNQDALAKVSPFAVFMSGAGAGGLLAMVNISIG